MSAPYNKPGRKSNKHGKQIPCDEPGCKAILTGDLPRHKKRVHNKERHHFCEFEDCNRSKEGFYSFSALKVHVQSVHERVISHICPHQWIDESGEIFPCPSAYCDRSSLWRHRKNAHYWNAEDTDEQVAIPTPVPEKKKRRQNARTRTDPLPVLEKEPRRIGRAKITPRPRSTPSTSLLDDVTLITLKEEPVSQTVPQASVGTAADEEIDFGFNSLPSTSSHLPSQFQLKSEDINFILNQVASGSDFEPVVPTGPSLAPDVQTLVELKQWMLDPPQPAVTFDNANYGYAYSAQFAQAYGATTINPSALMLPAPVPAPALSPYEQGLMMYAAGNDMAAPYLPSRESSASPLGEHGMYDNAWVPDPVALDEFQRLFGYC